MGSDPTLVLASLVLAHLSADFVLQNDRIAHAKAGHGRRAVLGLAAHASVVAVCLAPIAAAFGQAGLVLLGVVTVSHAVVDRVKVLLTRRAEYRALAAAHRREAESRIREPAGILGPGWTPAPAFLFIADQFVHLAVLGWSWAVFIGTAAPTAAWDAGIDAALGGWDRAVVHRIAVTVVVLASLVIVNVRGAAFFVGALVHPRLATIGIEGAEAGAGLSERRAAVAQGGATSRPAPVDGSLRRWRLRLGRLEATAEAESPEAARPSPGPAGGASRSPERVGATIGVLERLLIVTFVLTGSEAAIGFVVAAKTLARFRQLDDRDFAEYYLLGTLASVSVAIVTGLIARAALGSIVP